MSAKKYSIEDEALFTTLVIAVEASGVVSAHGSDQQHATFVCDRAEALMAEAKARLIQPDGP